MRKIREKSLQIRDFILQNVFEHPQDITRLTAEAYAISRPAVLHHINALIDEGTLTVDGTTRDRRYALAPLAEETFSFPIFPTTEEDHIWRHIIRPTLPSLTDNVLQICEYGLSEMINNVIDHSEGTESTIQITQNAARVEFKVIDNGVGIFSKIQRDLGLSDPRHAILELAKGKVTTDPARHTGEGIFFTSRAFDDFIVLSQGLFFSHKEPGEDWRLEHQLNVEGTTVTLGINPKSGRQLQRVFDSYTSKKVDYGFEKTRAPLSLATYGDENLISRSQARRILTRFHQFNEVLLDFEGIKSIGQAFADEIFRVYARNNPDIVIIAINTNEQIDKMVHRAQERHLPS